MSRARGGCPAIGCGRLLVTSYQVWYRAGTVPDSVGIDRMRCRKEIALANGGWWSPNQASTAGREVPRTAERVSASSRSNARVRHT